MQIQGILSTYNLSSKAYSRSVYDRMGHFVISIFGMHLQHWKLIGDLISDQQSSQTQEHLVLELIDCTIHELTLNNWFLFVWNPVCMICSQLHVVKLCCALGKWSYCTSERPWDCIKAFPRFPIIISIHVLLNHLFCRTAMLECMSRWIL